jgi:hypothetical protein
MMVKREIWAHKRLGYSQLALSILIFAAFKGGKSFK